MTAELEVVTAVDPLTPEERAFVDKMRTKVARARAMEAVASKVPGCAVLVVEDGAPVKLVLPPPV